ncbi:MAG: PLP-dependent aminotransferase family protein [Verrucomicrobiia bacterium]
MRRTAVRELLQVTSRPDVISFAGGLPATELFPVNRVKEAVNAVLDRTGRQALQYAETEGIHGLRDWIARQFSRSQFHVQREHVFITSGGQQALDLVGRVLLDEGDRVIVENPTYLALLSAWRPLGVEFLPVPSDKDGMQVDKLEPLLKQHPKLIYLVPNFQNPQGTTLTQARRERLVALAQEYGIPLVEDNPYGDLRYDGNALPHLLALAGARGSASGFERLVIYTGTFSKVLMPGLRVGWVIAAPEVIEKLVQAKQAADLHTSTLSQYVALELVGRGFLEQFLPVLRQNYGERRDLMLAALARHFPEDVTWTRPDGGMFLMVTLPECMDAGAILPHALQQKVAFVPGEEFHLNGKGRNTMRLNFSNATPDKIETGIARLGAVVKNFAKT